MLLLGVSSLTCSVITTEQKATVIEDGPRLNALKYWLDEYDNEEMGGVKLTHSVIYLQSVLY